MKKLRILITCVTIVAGIVLFTKDSSVLAAGIDDTFSVGELSYKVTGLGDATTNGQVTITDFDETSPVTELTLPATVEYDGGIFDVVSAEGEAFDGADKIKTLTVSKNFRKFDPGQFLGFIKLHEETATVSTSLETIIVDEENPVLEVIDGVAYDMTEGKENFVFYPYNSSKTEFVVPDFFKTTTAIHANDNLIILLGHATHLESIVMPFEMSGRHFVENGMLCAWVNENNHDEGSKVYMIPQAMEEVVLSEHVVDMEVALDYTLYALRNQAKKFVVEGNPTFQSRDGCLYEGDAMILYPGARSESVFKIPEGTKTIGKGDSLVFLGNRNLKSLILPSSIEKVETMGLSSSSVKSVKIEGQGNIIWDAQSLDMAGSEKQSYHIYVENGNTTAKASMQKTLSHLADEYFHELGATPTVNITNVQTSIENEKDVKVSWTANEAGAAYEVRRYDTDGAYEVVGSTTETFVVDTTTAYNTAYQYEAVPYTLPVTSSNDAEDPLSTYRTYGTASSKVDITTPVQTYQGTYIYKSADGSETSVVKDIEANTSALQQAPKLPNVNGYVFEKWTSDLQNIESVDKDFVAKAVYKVKENTPEDKPGDKPNTPEDKPLPKPDAKPDASGDGVQTGDQANVLIPILLLVVAGAAIVVVRKKQSKG